MSDEIKKLKSLDKDITKFLEKSGMPSDEIEKLTKKLKSKKDKEGELNIFAGSDIGAIVKTLETAWSYKKMEARLIEAIKDIKIEPQITVKAPNVYVEPKEPKVVVNPTPAPEVTVHPPKITLQERPFPKEMVVKGFASFVKAIVTILRGQLNVKLGNISKKTPLPVVLTHESKFYKAMLVAAGGGGGGRVWIKNSKNQVVNPLSQQHTEITTGTAKVVTAGTRVQLADVDCKRVWIQSSDWNADATHCSKGGIIVVGGALVAATPVALKQGKLLYATQGDWFFVDNLNRLYIDSLDSGARIFYYVEN